MQKNRISKVYAYKGLLALVIISVCIAAFFSLRNSYAATIGPSTGGNTAVKSELPDTIAQRGTPEERNPGTVNSAVTKEVTPTQSRAVSGSTSTSAAAQNATAADTKMKAILAEKNINASSARFSILIDKTDHVLSLYANGIFIKSYHVELGDSGLGDKAVSGDHKTPEGTFYISEKSVLSPADQYLGTRWMRLSYPNMEDAERGLDQGLISRVTYNAIVNAINNGTTPPQKTALGGGVGIHGGSTPTLGKDWTYGCTGLTNKDVEEIYPYIKVGTKVIIRK